MLIKSERLRKLESELRDLENWLKLGLVPKKDISKHKEEIGGIQEKIDEEIKRLEALRQSGEVDETAIPGRKGNQRNYADTPTLHGMGMTEESGMTEGFDFDTEAMDTETETDDTEGDDDETEAETEAESDTESADDDDDDFTEDPFSDTNRWRRGIRDPDSDEW